MASPEAMTERVSLSYAYKNFGPCGCTGRVKSFFCNGGDRRLRRKQGAEVGAAASRMRGSLAGTKQTLGAATRIPFFSKKGTNSRLSKKRENTPPPVGKVHQMQSRIASPMAVQPRQVQPSLMLSAVRSPLSSTLATASSMSWASAAMPKE